MAEDFVQQHVNILKCYSYFVTTHAQTPTRHVVAERLHACLTCPAIKKQLTGQRESPANFTRFWWPRAPHPRGSLLHFERPFIRV